MTGSATLRWGVVALLVAGLLAFALAFAGVLRLIDQPSSVPTRHGPPPSAAIERPAPVPPVLVQPTVLVQPPEPMPTAVEPVPAPVILPPLPTLAQQLAGKRLRLGAPVFVRIFKEERELEVWIAKGGRYALFKAYAICAYSGGLGPKLREGDHQSPEGFYEVGVSQLNPRSRFHLAFNLGFPNAFDRAHGRTGTFLMVHGDCLSVGCYAMTNHGIGEIYKLVEAALQQRPGTVPVHIFPFRMTDANMIRHAASPWQPFWADLKPAHDAFESSGVPPTVAVREGRYVMAK